MLYGNGRVGMHIFDYDKALEYTEKALSISRKVFGENHSNVAIKYYHIGMIYFSQGDYTKALEYYNNALSIWKTVLGESHLYVAFGYHKIGLVYLQQSKFDTALEYFEQALSIEKAVLGENNSNTLKTKEKIEEVRAKMVEVENSNH